jgi:mono/diheme cytochrome c family protein
MRFAILFVCIFAATAVGETPAERGYRNLTTRAYLPPDFDQQTFDELWKVWEEPLRSRAEKASVAARRRMAFERYGLTPRPDEPAKPLQYVVDERGNWHMNCFACHGGQVMGKTTPGAPNSNYALATLVEEVRATKIRLDKKLTHMDLGSLFIPLGENVGTTNSVIFGVALMAKRDADLVVRSAQPMPKLVNHDLDPPAWWHFKKRSRLYIDGFEAKHHRPLMQMLLVQQNGPTKFRQWEADFKDVFAYLESIEPPKYPGPIDRELAARGEAVFNRNCAKCHGTYGPRPTYPNRIVPIDVIGTDRVRLDAMTPEAREHYSNSWFGEYGRHRALREPGGYVAPPLDGIWATAPYFHNGSVPTLWHVLRSQQRPKIWRRATSKSPDESFDTIRVGPKFEMVKSIPESLSNAERRHYFDTTKSGKSNAGHTFGDLLDEEEKRAVVEYLKSL